MFHSVKRQPSLMGHSIFHEMKIFVYLSFNICLLALFVLYNDKNKIARLEQFIKQQKEFVQCSPLYTLQ